MARRKGLIAQILADRAKARAAAQRVAVRRQKAAAMAEKKARQEQERLRLAAERSRKAAEAKAERERTLELARAARARDQARAKSERERARAAAAKERAKRAAAAVTARNAKAEAVAKIRAAADAERAAKRLAIEAKISEALHKWTSVQADIEAFESVLANRAHAAPEIALGLEKAFNNGGAETFTDGLVRQLAASVYPTGVGGPIAAEYRPELRELVIELELPKQTTIPNARSYRYVRATGEVSALPRKDVEIRSIYSRLIARMVLRTLAEVFESTPHVIVTQAAVSGYVSTKDRATGRPIRPCLISVGATREEVADLKLDEPELDPQGLPQAPQRLGFPTPL